MPHDPYPALCISTEPLPRSCQSSYQYGSHQTGFFIEIDSVRKICVPVLVERNMILVVFCEDIRTEIHLLQPFKSPPPLGKFSKDLKGIDV